MSQVWTSVRSVNSLWRKTGMVEELTEDCPSNWRRISRWSDGLRSSSVTPNSHQGWLQRHVSEPGKHRRDDHKSNEEMTWDRRQVYNSRRSLPLYPCCNETSPCFSTTHTLWNMKRPVIYCSLIPFLLINCSCRYFRFLYSFTVPKHNKWVLPPYTFPGLNISDFRSATLIENKYTRHFIRDWDVPKSEVLLLLYIRPPLPNFSMNQVKVDTPLMKLRVGRKIVTRRKIMIETTKSFQNTLIPWKSTMLNN